MLDTRLGRPYYPLVNAEQVKAIRAKAGMTQVEFSREVGVDAITISRWERGRSVMLPVFEGIIAAKFGTVTSRAHSPAKTSKKQKNKAA